MELIGKLFKLPSGNVVRVTDVRVDEDVDPRPLVFGVYEQAAEPETKSLRVREDWFTGFAINYRPA